MSLTLSEVKRSAGIDVLRGVCVVLVVLHHIHLRFKLNQFDVEGFLPAPLEQIIFWSGYLAVITFFVISGFLITSLTMRRWGALPGIQPREFYRLRFARIAPCLALLVATLSCLHWMQVQGFVINPERSSLGRAVLAALTFHINWLEGHHGYLPGSWDILWSLSVEEVFYLLFPLVCLLCRSERALLLPLIALVAIGPFNRIMLAGQDPWQDYAYLSCADGIAFGCLAALAAARIALRREVLRALMTLGATMAVAVVGFRGSSVISALHQMGIGISILEIGVALMLIAISQGVGADLFTRRTGYIRVIGRSSYEIYLTHMLVILGSMPLIKAFNPSGVAIAAWYAVLLALSLILGWVVYRCYSEPMNERLRRSATTGLAAAGRAP